MAASPAAPFPAFFFPSTGNNNADEDDEFGDFEFAPPSPSLQPISTATATTTAAAAAAAATLDEDGDEWGDFVESPIPRSDPFSSFPVKQEEQPRWERSKGAIPLSIFGDEEDEEPPSGSGDPSLKDSFFPPRGVGGADSSGKDSIFPPKVGKPLEGVAITDLLDDLYGKVDASNVEGSGGVGSGNGAAVVVEEEEDDFDEGGWEFKCAVADDGGFGDVGSVQVAKEDGDFKKEILQLEVGSSKQELDNGGVQHDSLISPFDLFSGIIHSAGYNGNRGFNTENGSISNMVNGNASFDKKHTDVKHATSKDGILDLLQWKEGEAEDNAHTSGKDNLHTSKEKFQDLGNLWGSHMEDVTMPPSNTGKQDPDRFLDAQNDFFAFEQSPTKSGAKDKNADHVPSFNDLLLDLYAEHGQGSSFDSKNSHDNDRNSATEVAYFNNMNSGNDLQDIRMPMENGLLERVQDQTFKCVVTHQIHAEPAPENPVGFYSKLKEVSCFLALDHLHDLKKAHKLAVLSDEETKARELHLQIQAAYTKLQLKDEDSKNVAEDERCNSHASCNQLLECLKHLKIQAFEMEYSLSEKIKLAQGDLASAVQLFEHAATMLNILQLGPRQEQQDYIAAWSKILAVCEQELQHGATILAQSLQTGVREKILSEPKGCDYFLALGEIYRTAETLNTSLTVYKPWIISNPVGSKDPFAIVSRCYKFWMDAGLWVALEYLSAQADLKSKETIKRILESIDLIHNLNAATILSHMSSLKEPICRLSLLPLGMLPDMDVVAWNGEKYFVKLANLWANLISGDPPKLRCALDG